MLIEIFSKTPKLISAKQKLNTKRQKTHFRKLETHFQKPKIISAGFHLTDLDWILLKKSLFALFDAYLRNLLPTLVVSRELSFDMNGLPVKY